MAESQMRGLLSRVVSNHHTVVELQKQWSAVVREIEGLKERWHSDRIVTAEASPMGCTAETLRAVSAWTKRYGLIWTVHVQTEQVAHLWDEHRLGPFEDLNTIGVLDGKVLAAHCNVLAPGEIKLMAEVGMRVAHAPVAHLWASNPVATFSKLSLRASGSGLGVDGPKTNNGQNLWESMEFCIYVQKQKYPHPLSVGSPELALELATIRAAESIGIGDQVGSLEAGKRGDVILLDRSNPGLNPIVGLIANLVYSGSPEAVRTVIIGNRSVLEERRSTLIDEEEAVLAANRVQRAMVEAAGLGAAHAKRSQWLFL